MDGMSDSSSLAIRAAEQDARKQEDRFESTSRVAYDLAGYPIDQFRTIADIKVFPFR